MSPVQQVPDINAAVLLGDVEHWRSTGWPVSGSQALWWRRWAQDWTRLYIQYDTIEEFNVDSKAECGQLNLAHVRRTKKYKKKKPKQTNASAHLVQYRFKIREGSPEGTRKTMEERICERHEF